jgi:ppGpp synthetase/RelA/SpoT-type nucleotidyltranferase
MDIEQYVREGQAAYADLAATIAMILGAAISAEQGGYRLQQVSHRAKEPDSLRKKLQCRGIQSTTTLEDDIKDLAGCRMVFYTNSDATRFFNSGIVRQNFEVMETQSHYPQREAEDETGLYIAYHHLVCLRSERSDLPEYARFAQMRCEIQIQTVLHHAWAAMNHDIIYKAPALPNDFGGNGLKAIKSRLEKVARQYLLPASYEFDKIADDFQRLIAGKKLFNGDALTAIVEAADNNARADALEKFTAHVLPFYDDLQAVYPEIVEKLVQAANQARTAPKAASITTPFGALPPKTYADVLKAITNVFSQLRYLDVEATFDALCTLYGWAEYQDEKKPLLELGNVLAKYEMNVWQKYGPEVQAVLLECIEKIGNEERCGLTALLTDMVIEMLGVEIRGATHSSSSITIHRGTVPVSEELRFVRAKAIDLLKHQFHLADDDKTRHGILQALQKGTHLCMGANSELRRLVMNNTSTIIAFLTEIAPKLSFEHLQETEDSVLRCYRNYGQPPESLRDDSAIVEACKQVETAALTFRDTANANREFVIYKTLVGYNPVFQPAWTDRTFEYKQRAIYRSERIKEFVTSVNETDAEVWFDRIKRCASTSSNDLMTFPAFTDFLKQLATTQPTIVLGYMDRLEAPLTNFLPCMLAGVMDSVEHAQVLTRIDDWLVTGQYVAQIACYLRFADPFDEGLLQRTFESASKHGDKDAIRNSLIAAAFQAAAHPGSLIGTVFFPALQHLIQAQDYSWLRMGAPWLDNPLISELDQEQSRVVLNALEPYPELKYGAEWIVVTIAKNWPELVIDFIGNRFACAQADAAPQRYEAVPFCINQLKDPLASVPTLMLKGARAWFNADPHRFTWEGGKLLASVFPDITNGFGEGMKNLIANGNQEDLEFALSVLSAFDGRACIDDYVRDVIAALPLEHTLLVQAHCALLQSGVVYGEFGLSEQYAERKKRLEPWLNDPSESVRTFAKNRICKFDGLIAEENRRVEEKNAQRKLAYGEDLVVANTKNTPIG